MNLIAFQSAQLTIAKLYKRIRYSIFNSSDNTCCESKIKACDITRQDSDGLINPVSYHQDE